MNTIFAASLLASIASAAFASATLPDRFEYAAKFVCGVESFQTAPAPSEPVVNPGNYTTAVNIHNPWQFPVTVTKQIVISNPERFPDTRFEVPTARVVEKIPSGSAMYVDCTEIVNLLKSHGAGISGSFIEGFVVIDSFALVSSKVPTAEELVSCPG